MQLLRQSLRSLALHKLRTLLSSLGLLFGVAAVVAMGAIGEGAKRQAMEQIAKLGTHTVILRSAVEEEGGLTSGQIARLRGGLPTLSHLAPVAVSTTDVGEQLATTPDFAHIRQLQVAQGRFLCDDDLHTRRPVCVLGADLAQSLRRQVGQTLRLNEGVHTIVGILQSTYWEESSQSALAMRDLNQLLFVPLVDVDKLDEMILQVADGGEIERTALAAARLLPEGVQIVVPHMLLAQAQRTQRTFSLVLGSIAAISLLVGGIGIANSMLASVSERRREIGIRRALGATRSAIAMQFLTETLLLTLFGGFAGLGMGAGLGGAIARFAGWPVVGSWTISLLAVGMALLTGLCAGLSPALRAARQDPVANLASH